VIINLIIQSMLLKPIYLNDFFFIAWKLVDASCSVILNLCFSDHAVNAFMQMEVGIEDCLHIEFEYSKSK